MTSVAPSFFYQGHHSTDPSTRCLTRSALGEAELAVLHVTSPSFTCLVCSPFCQLPVSNWRTERNTTCTPDPFTFFPSPLPFDISASLLHFHTTHCERPGLSSSLWLYQAQLPLLPACVSASARPPSYSWQFSPSPGGSSCSDAPSCMHTPPHGCYRRALFLQTDPLHTALVMRHSKRQKDFLSFNKYKNKQKKKDQKQKFHGEDLYKFARLAKSVSSCSCSSCPHHSYFFPHQHRRQALTSGCWGQGRNLLQEH